MQNELWGVRNYMARNAEIQMTSLLSFPLCVGNGYCWAKPQTRSYHRHRCSWGLRHNLCRGSLLAYLNLPVPCGTWDDNITSSVSCFLWHVLLHACFSSLFWRSGNHYAGGVHRKAIVKMRAWSKLIRSPDFRFVTTTPYTFLVYLITDHTLELSKIEKKGQATCGFTIINCVWFWRENERVNCAAVHSLHLIGWNRAWPSMIGWV